MRQTIHIPHQDLLLWIDGELSAHRAGEIRQHVNACWTCRTRVAELEQTIGEFVQLHRREFEGKIPSSEGPRALLKARLAEQTEAAVSRRSPARMVQFRIAATVAMGILLSGIAFWRYQRAGIDEAFYRTIPNQSLTPGAIDPVNKYDVCNGNVPVNDPAVPDPLRRQVLQAYGLTNVSNKEYEIDYLVTPKLGGAINIRNLWPEPSTHTVWTAM